MHHTASRFISALWLVGNLSGVPLLDVEPIVMRLPVGCGILVTSHEEDGSHEFEFMSLVGMRTSHVCALRTQDLYAQMPPVPTFVIPYQVGNITFGGSTQRDFILHCHSFYSFTYRPFRRLNYFTSPR
jgi:hypothetical protein